MKTDPRTGRAFGDHGTAMDAIEWCLHRGYDEDSLVFLKAWNEGNLSEWPDYYDWLRTRNR